MVIKLPKSFVGSFNYVDCGAVGDLSNSLLSAFDDSRFIGFDPELTVPVEKNDSSVYFPVAVSKESGQVDFHRTKNLNCSSVYVPNQEFLDRFIEVGDFFRIIETIPLKVVALDEYLPQHGINEIDFIELDTQGSELGILQGAKDFLSSSILGVRVEVEFSAMYQDQPLFSDVDSFLRKFGFMLFDLERYHLRRKAVPPDGVSREQIVWGQALYFKDWRYDLASSTKQSLCKLAVISSFYGFHSYALEIIEYLISDDVKILTLQEKKELKIFTVHEFQKKQGQFNMFYKYIYNKVLRPFNWLKKKATPAISSDYFWKD